MRAMFEPLGKQARWRTVYEILSAAPMNGLVTYGEMGDALGLDPDRDRSVIQQAVHRAAREHEAIDKRAIDVVAGKGYRIVEPAEHLGLAQRHQRKSSKALARGHSKAVNVDLNGLEPQVRAALEVVGHAFRLQMDFNRRLDVRQSKLEQTVRDIADGQRTDRKRTDEEVAELRERLARLESQLSNTDLPGTPGQRPAGLGESRRVDARPGEARHGRARHGFFRSVQREKRR